VLQAQSYKSALRLRFTSRQERTFSLVTLWGVFLKVETVSTFDCCIGKVEREMKAGLDWLRGFCVRSESRDTQLSTLTSLNSPYLFPILSSCPLRKSMSRAGKVDAKTKVETVSTFKFFPILGRF
jgi:hypothetical protein